MLNTISASVFKEIVYRRRYLVNTIFNIIVFYLIFLALLGGVRVFGGDFVYDETIAGLIVSFYSWTMMLSVFTSTAYLVEANKMYGTLETLTANSRSLILVLITESVVDILFFFVFSLLNIFLFSITAGVSISYNILSLLVVVFTGLISMLGLSLVIAGITLIIRKAGNALNLMQFILLGILFLPSTIYTQIFVPFFSAFTLLEKIMVDNLTIITVPSDLLLFLFINAVIYFTIGIVTFTLCLKKGMKKGYLGFY